LARWLVINGKVGLACTPPLQGFKGLDLKKDELYEYLEGQDYFQHYYVAAMAKPWDYIGEVYEDLGLVNMGQNMTPRCIVEFMTKMTYTERREISDGEAEWFCYNSYRSYLVWYWLTYHGPPTHLKPMDPPLHTQLDTLGVMTPKAKALCGHWTISNHSESDDAEGEPGVVWC